MELRVEWLDRACLVVVVAVCVGSGYAVVGHALKERREIRQERELLSKRTEELALADTSLQRLNVLLESAKAEMRAVDESIPDSARMGHFLKELDGLMRDRRIGLVSIQPMAPVEEKLYRKIPLHLVLEGTFVDICRLLHDLETMGRIVVVERMVMTRPSGTRQCRLELTAGVFERKGRRVRAEQRRYGLGG